MPVRHRNGNSWLITISNGFDEKGKRIRITKTVYANNKTEAIRQEKILAAKVAKKFELNPRSMTLRKFYEYFTKNYLEAQQRAPKTIQSYNELFRRIDAALGHKPIDKILQKHILEFLEQLRECPNLSNGGKLSANTIRKHYILLNTIFKKAVKWNFILDNPCDSVDSPKYRYNNQKTILTSEELGRFLIALNNEDIKYRVWAILTLSLGLRRGESLALQWKHIDLKKKTLTVEQSVQYIVKKGLSIKSPKTVTSNRILELSDDLIDLLIAYKKIKQQYQKKMANNWLGPKSIEDNFIFTTKYGNISHVDSVNIWLKKFCKKNNLPNISPHSLRHMTATYLIYAGLDIVSIASVMGHANSTTVQLVYAHPLQEAKKNAVAMMSKILADSKNLVK